MKFKNTEVFNFEGALRGMRNPLQSHNKSDSHYWLPNEHIEEYEEMCNEDIGWEPYYIGDKDIELAQRLILAGNEHAKFMRQIFVSVDITAPQFWWSEADTYKISTVANSSSKMHKISSTPITLDCFETDDMDKEWLDSTGIEAACDTWINDNIIYFLESLRQEYLRTKDIRYWKELIRWLPESWLQTRTWTANYAVLRNIYFQRRNHKLIEWHEFCDWVETLPYAKELITLEKKDV